MASKAKPINQKIKSNQTSAAVWAQRKGSLIERKKEAALHLTWFVRVFVCLFLFVWRSGGVVSHAQIGLTDLLTTYRQACACLSSKAS